MTQEPRDPRPRPSRASERGRPEFSDIDAWGLTHPGLVREDNQDHFFLGSLACGVHVEGTSLRVGVL